MAYFFCKRYSGIVFFFANTDDEMLSSVKSVTILWFGISNDSAVAFLMF